MSSQRITEIDALPTHAALEAMPVLTGEKRGASVQLSDVYFENQLSVLRRLDETAFAERIGALQRSYETLDSIQMRIDAFEQSALQDAAMELYETARETPEAIQFRENFPGTSFTVPELLRTENSSIDFGWRTYFFRADEAPEPQEVVRRNVAEVINDSEREFERYQGGLHGYPDCCIERFLDRPSTGPPPEQRSVDALESVVRSSRIGQSGVSITDILPDFFEHRHAYAFFSRAFFPEPDCGTAQSRGKRIYESLVTEVPEPLVRDYFRLNYALCYTLAHSLTPRGGELPRVGTLGTEHVYSYLPLANALTVPRYDHG
ncbi:hypothetical protein [Haladaptatus sp. NG-WS-4]